ncbi:mitochondrial substrate carrier family protein [Hibiscus syriacus]|uniref:Mitochondrial substrate carrier family protein n=1 Tax=Hibiscus syriacus TaxID=106335 RepID=A0A6A3AE46_HIBSY|nr:mitochondrial substrate carrier family protein [Hibiscus syriacus]
MFQKSQIDHYRYRLLQIGHSPLTSVTENTRGRLTAINRLIWMNHLGKLTYDLEWDNDTSFIYTKKECRVLHFDVGVLRPNWLDKANYLGQQHKDGFLCNVWEKVDFIWYYEDVITKRPVYWAFYTGYTAHVMTFEVGVVLEDSEWQAPVYCFKEDEEKRKQAVIGSLGMISRLLVKLMRGVSSASMAL